jgi:hypothetical protein
MPDWAQSRGRVPEIEVIIGLDLNPEVANRNCPVSSTVPSRNPYKLSEARNAL